VKQLSIDTLRDWMTLALAGLGVSLSPHEFLGGLLLAMAAASLIARHRRNNRRLLGTVATGAFAAVVAVEVGQIYGFWGWSPQLVMIAAGAVSGWGVSIFIVVMDQAENRSGRIANWLFARLFPPSNGEDK
jgi:hypothetical protein